MEFSQEAQGEAFTIISSNDVKHMEILFTLLHSPDSTKKNRGQSIIRCCQTHFPSLLFIKLLFVVRCSTTDWTRSSAVRILVEFVDAKNLWSKLSSHAKSITKFQFIEFLQRQEESIAILRQMCAVVSRLVVGIYEAGDNWHELIDFLVNSIQVGSSNKLQEVSLLVFVNLPQDGSKVIGQALTPQIENLYRGFLNALVSSSVDVEITALKASVRMKYLFAGSRYSFSELLWAMMLCIFNLLNKSKPCYAMEGIKELVFLAKEEAEDIKPLLNNLVLSITVIIECESMDERTRNGALNMLMTLLEINPLAPALRELPYENMLKLFMVLFRTLLRIDKDVEWYEMGSAEGEDAAGKSETYKYVQECLKRLSVAWGGEITLNVFFTILPPYMHKNDSRKRHAGLVMLEIIANLLSDEMVMVGKYLEEVVLIILKSFEDGDPHVRWAAFHFMQLRTNLVESIQILYHHRILPAYVAALDGVVLDGRKNPRVQEQVVSALLHFARNIPLDNSSGYRELSNMLRKLLILLQDSDMTMKATVAALCTSNILAMRFGSALLRNHAAYLPILLESCIGKNLELKKEAVRGIRICAEFARSEFEPFVKRAVSVLTSFLGARDFSSSEDHGLFDTAVCALGKISEFHYGHIDTTKLIPTWLRLLPITNDVYEAKIAHEQLFSMVERSDRKLLGPRGENFTKVVAVFLQVVMQGNTLATAQTVQRMENLLKRMWQRLPPTVLDKIRRSLDAPLQQLLAVILRP